MIRAPVAADANLSTAADESEKMNWRTYRKTLYQDLLAGASGAIAGAPQAMGFAILAGINPIYGLYTAAVSTVIASLFTSSTLMTVAPTNSLALVVGSRLMTYGEADTLDRLFVLTLLVGVFQLAFGLLKLGHFSRFVSNAVMTGFITGAGLLIVIGQIHHLVGFNSSARGPLPTLWDWITHLPDTHLQTLIVGLISIVIIAGLHRTRFRGYATLIALVLTALMITWIGWDNVMIVRDMSVVPSGLPAFNVPEFSYGDELALAALAIAMLASVQGAAIANALPQPDGSSANVSRDMAGQGIANVVSSFFQGMPSGGSLSRTAVNVNAGAKTRLSNIFAGLLIGLVLLLLGGFIEQIALAALAGHLIVAATSLIRFDQIRIVWNVHWSGRAAMVATFVATMVMPLEYSIYTGVLLSLVLYVYTSSQGITVTKLVAVPDHRFREEPVGKKLPYHDTVIYSINGDLYFAAVAHLEEQLPPPSDSEDTTVILRMRNVGYIGSTAIRFLQRYDQQLKAHGGKLVLSGVSPLVKEQLSRADGIKYFGLENIFFAEDVLFSATEEALASNNAKGR